MRNFMKLLSVIGLSMGLWACSSEDDVFMENPEEGNEQVYMQFRVQRPQPGRSSTNPSGGSSDGTEPGQDDYENKIVNVSFVLSQDDAANGYTIIARSNMAVVGTGSDYVVPIDMVKIQEYQGRKVLPWIFCNPTADIRNKIKESTHIKDLVLAVNPSIWGGVDYKGGFLMSNAEVAKVNPLPADLKPYNNKSNPYNFGNVNVERSAVRFDFRVAEDGQKKDNCFPITTAGEKEENKNPNIEIQLTHAALINQSKNFFGVRQVSDDGLPSGANFWVAGVETGSNYVVATDAQKKLQWDPWNGQDWSGHFDCAMDRPDEWVWVPLPTAETAENTENGSDSQIKKTDWRRLFYGSENTIPAGPENQVNGISTGVVFRGKLHYVGRSSVNDYGVNIDNPSTTAEPIYVYGNVLYGTWDKVAEKVAELEKNGHNTEPVVAAYHYATLGGEATGSGEKVDVEKAVKIGFSIYAPQIVDNICGYYLDYYYWNYHNDNNKPTEMGVMEFAAVRNNVYKLSITKVHQFGHPTDSKQDPDPVDPTDPDERENAYFQVVVHVLPWVVRTHDIEL